MNFTVFLFDKSPYPTVGFRLQDAPDTGKITNAQLAYLWALFQTMATAHDKFREQERLQSFKSYDIKTPAKIRFDSFDLKPSDAEELFRAGKIGDEVPWADDDHSSEGRFGKYFDPGPAQGSGHGPEAGSETDRGASFDKPTGSMLSIKPLTFGSESTGTGPCTTNGRTKSL